MLKLKEQRVWAIAIIRCDRLKGAKHTGGVNLCYMLLDLYCVKTRQSQVLHTYIFYCIGISITNSWLLYQCHMQQQNISKKDKFTLLAFHTEISDNRQSKNDLSDVTRP